MSSPSENERIYAEAVVRHGKYTNVRRLMNHVRYILGDVSDVECALDIGGGVGILSFYLASQGANKVICLEPEAAGSTEGVTSEFDMLQRDVPNGDRVVLENTTFQRYDPAETKFDYIVSANSINHLNEPACIDLKSNGESYETYLSYFRRIYDMLESGGRFIATDCSRYNLFGDLGLTNPFARDIEWEKHQSPYQWRDMLMEVGFVEPKIQWTAYNVLGSFGRLVMNNPVVSYLMLSHFRLRVQKP